MRSVLILVVSLLLLVAVSTAMAQPYVSVWGEEAVAQQMTSSWFGSVGLIRIPSAAIPPSGAGTLTYHRIQRSPDDINVYGLNVGVSDYLEVGGTHIDIPGDSSENVVNAKLGVPAAKWLDNDEIPGVAVGAFDIGNNLDRSYYIVVSKAVALSDAEAAPKINLHLGFGRSDSRLSTPGFDGIFGGAEFAVMGNALIQAEYDGDAFNAALRYNFSPQFQIDLGILDGDFGYGATYRSHF